jgi:hypothetical protein
MTDALSTEIAVKVFGYCHATSAEIITLIGSGLDREVVHLGGNFVVVAERGREVWVITSPYGAGASRI